MASEPVDYSVRVSTREFAAAVKLATIAVRPRNFPQIRLSLEDGILFVMGPGASQSIHAEGSWPSAVLADAGVLKRLAPKLPKIESLILKMQDSRLFIGSFSMNAV